MSKYAWVIIITLTSLTGFAQGSSGVCNVYAYSREVIGGAAPTVIIDQQGNEHEQPVKPVLQYFIFVEVAPSRPITVKNLWINKTLYEITVEAVKATPVFLTENALIQKPERDMLVPKTGKAVFQVKIRSRSRARLTIPSSIAKTKNVSEVIIEYVYKGKRHYHMVSAIKKLDPLTAQ